MNDMGKRMSNKALEVKINRKEQNRIVEEVTEGHLPTGFKPTFA
jgi:hypothetical protein